MRYHPCLVILFLAPGSLVAASKVDTAARGPREATEIKTGWRFQIDSRNLGEREHWYAAGFDRSGWRDVDVPRAWDLFDEALKGYEGIGWYSVILDGSWARPGKVQNLTFGRVMYHAKVWLNGELMGEHEDGYLPFTFDVTGKLKGSVNHLVMRVDNQPRIDWLPAAKQIEWVQYGGILQPVRVETHGPIFLSDLTIRAVPQVMVHRSLAPSRSMPARERRRRCREDRRLDGRRPTAAALARHPHRHPRSGGASRPEVTLTLGMPRLGRRIRRFCTLWSRRSNGKAGNRSPGLAFGVRTIAVSGRQLLLNGQPLKIKGVNRYDEYGRFGPNPPPRGGRAALMKKTGVNLIRSHYPQSPSFLTSATGWAFSFWRSYRSIGGASNGSEKRASSSARILERAIPMLETMIRRDRNHPSVIIWSMANESKTDNEIGIKVMRALIGRTKELDPTRLVTFVTAPGSVREHRAFEQADLVATNMYHGSISEPLVEHRDHRSAASAGRRASSTGAGRVSGQAPLDHRIWSDGHARPARGCPETEDLQADYLRAIWTAISGTPDVSGASCGHGLITITGAHSRRTAHSAHLFDRDVRFILGLPFDVVSLDEAEAKLRASIRNRNRCVLTTPNLDFVVGCLGDAAFRNSVLRCDLSVADGWPIVFVARLLGAPLRERVAGSDLFERLRRGPPESAVSVYFFGGPEGAADAACRALNAEGGGTRCGVQMRQDSSPLRR